MIYLNTFNFKRKVNINRDNIYINIYNIPLIYIKESKINSQHATILSRMYMHTLACFCESQRRLSSLLSLKYLYISFFCLLSLLPDPCLLPCLLSVPLLHSSPGARPSAPLSPPFPPSACPPLLLLLCVSSGGCPAVCRLSCSLPYISPSGAPRSSPAGSCVFSLCVCVSCRVSCCLSVTRPLSGARRYDSGGRCSA